MSKLIPQKPRLGRGLSSLISNVITAPEPASHGQTGQFVSDSAAEPKVVTVTVTDPKGTPAEIKIDDISPNPYQPRREFRPEELQELTDSIRLQGILQPLVICPANGSGANTSFVLIAGERRLRAARLAGRQTVPCVIKDATHQQMLEWALIENIQRSDLNPVERATAYRDHMDRFKITQQEASERLGLPRATIANYLRMLDLCDEVQQLLLAGKLTFGHAKVLAGLVHQSDLQLRLAQKVAQEELSVRQLEGLIAAAQSPGGQPATKTAKTKAPYIRDLEDQLTQVVGTKVFIQPGRAKNTGRLLIDYYSLEDFERLSSCLGLKRVES